MFLGCSFTSEPKTCIPTPPAADSVEVLEIQSAIFDELFATQAVIENFDGTIPAEWTFDVRLHVYFENSLYGGNVSFTEKIVDAVRIKKRTSKDSKFQTIFERKIYQNEDFNIELIDYLEPVGKVDYAYVPIISGGESDYIVSTVDSSFDSYFLVEKDRAYPLILETSVNETVNYNVGTIKPMGRKYPITIINGKSGYKSGDVDCLFMELTNCKMDIDNTNNYRQRIYEMLTNGTPKLLKDYDGNLYMISVNNSITESDRALMLHEGIPITYVKSKFSWVECGDAYHVGDLYYNGFIDVNLG